MNDDQPLRVAGLIERRIARLSPEEQAMLEAASVCGVGFNCRTVGEAISREPAWVAERCESLVRRLEWLRALGMSRHPDGMLDSRYRFSHALYRHALYQRIGGHARAQLHGNVARSLEARHDGPNGAPCAVIAYHFEQGHEPMAALRQYAAAVENSLDRFAPAEAVQLIDRATALLPGCPRNDERFELELMLLARRDATGSLLSGVNSPRARPLLRAPASCATSCRRCRGGYGWNLDSAGVPVCAALCGCPGLRRTDPRHRLGRRRSSDACQCIRSGRCGTDTPGQAGCSPTRTRTRYRRERALRALVAALVGAVLGACVDDFHRWLSGWSGASPARPGSASLRARCNLPADYAYSNASYGLLGLAVANAYATPWEQLIAARITAPLGMADTVISPSGSQRSRLAQGHGKAGQPVMAWPRFAWAPAGGLRSTPQDMLNYGEAALGHSVVGGHRCPTS